MKNVISTLLLFGILWPCIHAQRELTVTEMGSDNDAVIEINGENPAATDFKQMILGFNASSGAWLRTITDDDLSFWTNNNSRMTIKNDGKIGIGTNNPLSKLFLQNGRLGLETETVEVPFAGSVLNSEQTGVDFYTGNNQVASLRYTNTVFPSLTLENSVNGPITLATNALTRVEIDGGGDVKVYSLAGTDTRNLMVASDGTLVAENNTSKYHVIAPTHFVKSAGTPDATLSYLPHDLRVFFGFLEESGLVYAQPSISYTKYKVDAIEVRFWDRSDEDMTFTFNINGNDYSYTSNSNTNSLQVKTINIGEIVDQAQGDVPTFSVRFRDEENSSVHSFNKAIIRYTIIY